MAVLDDYASLSHSRVTVYFVDFGGRLEASPYTNKEYDYIGNTLALNRRNSLSLQQ